MSIKKILRNLLLDFFYITRDRKSNVVFFRSMNDKYSDNQRAISEALYKLNPNIQQVWYGNGDGFPSHIKCVNKYVDVMKSMAQSKAWVLNLSFSWKPKSVFNIATWHGDRGFKKVIYDNDPIRKRDHKAIYGMDLYLSGSRFGTEVSRSAFRYKGEIQETGCPRNDKLVHPIEYKNESEQIKQKLGIPTDSKIILYAPTFRDNLNTEQLIPFDYRQVVNILEEKGDKCFLLVRAHVLSKGIDTCSDERLIDASDFPDMADLLLVTDLLLTDYSSCCCDYILTHRPCIMLQYDDEEYKKNCREFKVSPKEAGFCIANNDNELIEFVKNIDTIDFVNIAESINDFYGTKETGHSAEDTAKRIIEWLNQTHKKQ